MQDAALNLIEAFLRELRSGNLSPHTATAYRHDLQAFASFACEQGLQQWRDVEGQQLRAFAAA